MDRIWGREVVFHQVRLIRQDLGEAATSVVQTPPAAEPASLTFGPVMDRVLPENGQHDGVGGQAAVFDELGLPFPTLEVVAGWNGESRVLPNPITILSAWRRTEGYSDWLGKRDVRTFITTNSAGYQFEIQAVALARSGAHLSDHERITP